MSFGTIFRIAFRELMKNNLRAGLTILGVVIGIAAVTTMVSIGQSATQLVQGQIQNLGSNVIIIFPEGRRRGGVRGGRADAPSLTSSDSEAIHTECAFVLAASPIVGTGGRLIYQNQNWTPRDMQGVGSSYLVVRNWTIQHGGFFTDGDIQSAEKVCVVGYTIVAKLFQTENPIGKTIRIGNLPVRIIGVLEKKGADMVGTDLDDIVLLPYTTVRKRINGSSFDSVHAIMASARSSLLIGDADHEIRQLLYERHGIAPGERADFSVQNTTEISQVLGIITGTLTILLSSIAGISLLVGGVGIMNIMLVSVTERTREIGIRMAVGARARDIRRQFLVESIMLSSIGGLIGLCLGTTMSVLGTLLINYLSSGSDWPIVISIPAAIVGMLFAAAVGMVFGLYPAYRASRLDPIEALRYE
ncbi:MAG: ABC transporter permease [Pirellulaceae bacterium]